VSSAVPGHWFVATRMNVATDAWDETNAQKFTHVLVNYICMGEFTSRDSRRG